MIDNYETNSHSVFLLQYHLILVTKYTRQENVLYFCVNTLHISENKLKRYKTLTSKIIVYILSYFVTRHHIKSNYYSV